MFKRSKRLSDAIRSIEQSYDNAVVKLGDWITAREQHLREVRLNREAMKFNARLDRACEIARRARQLRGEHDVVTD